MESEECVILEASWVRQKHEQAFDTMLGWKRWHSKSGAFCICCLLLALMILLVLGSFESRSRSTSPYQSYVIWNSRSVDPSCEVAPDAVVRL